eukprot:2274621-Pyramimonas_sp.AAC.1
MAGSGSEGASDPAVEFSSQDQTRRERQDHTLDKGRTCQSQDKMVTRNLKRAIIEERKLYRNVCRSCPEHADHRLRCPMRRPSRSPNFGGTPWVWSRGDGR